MTFLYCYLAVGVCVALYRVVRAGENPLAKRAVTLIGEAGVRREVQTRNVAEFIVTAAFDVLLWFVPLLFWTVYVPLHDARAQKAYMQAMVNDPQAWVPEDLQAEVAHCAPPPRWPHASPRGHRRPPRRPQAPPRLRGESP